MAGSCQHGRISSLLAALPSELAAVFDDDAILKTLKTLVKKRCKRSKRRQADIVREVVAELLLLVVKLIIVHKLVVLVEKVYFIILQTVLLQ